MTPPHIQQNKCCEKCKCNNLTKDHQFVRGIHTCDNSSCPCHSTPTQQKCEVCNDDPLFSCTVCGRQATETHAKHYKSEDFRQVVSPTQPEWIKVCKLCYKPHKKKWGTYCKTCLRKTKDRRPERQAKRIARQLLKSKDPERKANVLNYVKKYQEKNKEKISAHNKVKVALRQGVLQKLPCLICREKETHAHHPDYSQPLKVMWVCKLHHELIHVIKREEAKIFDISTTIQKEIERERSQLLQEIEERVEKEIESFEIKYNQQYIQEHKDLKVILGQQIITLKSVLTIINSFK